jgi:hypothetical protein
MSRGKWNRLTKTNGVEAPLSGDVAPSAIVATVGGESEAGSLDEKIDGGSPYLYSTDKNNYRVESFIAYGNSAARLEKTINQWAGRGLELINILPGKENLLVFKRF